MTTSEENLYALLKKAEGIENNEDDSVGGTAEVNEDAPGTEESWGDPGPENQAVFSDAVRAGSTDTRQGVPSRLLDEKPSSSTTARSTVNNVLEHARTGEFETSSIQLQTTKVSYPRTQTLRETVLGKIGRL